MSKTYCTACGDQITEEEIRWAFDERFCEDCFNDRFTYCDRCDSVLYRDEAHYDNSVPFCDDCWEDNYDENCPDNPEVSDVDREQIIAVSRKWLLGKDTPKYTLKISSNDYLLPKIRDKVGLVEQEIYVYGLRDRTEYQIATTSDLIDRIREYIITHQLTWRVIEETGCNRLGIAYSLREQEQSKVVSLVRFVTSDNKSERFSQTSFSS